MHAVILGLLTSLPNIIKAAQELIARGRQTGELTPAQADDLTNRAKMIFAQYTSQAPPPPPQP